MSRNSSIFSKDAKMEGVPYPVYAQDDLGYAQMMYPGMDYSFPGNYVTETPVLQIEEYKQGGVNKLKRSTSKNIQSSINQLMMRNIKLFGESGKRVYNPLAKMFEGGDPTNPSTNPNTTAAAPANSMSMEQYMDMLEKRAELQRMYENELARVQGVRKKTAEVALNKTKAKDKKTRTDLSYIKTGAYYCNTHTGECLQDAGATTPEGKKMPVIPGNLQWDSKMKDLGFEWVDEPMPGDVAREQIHRTTDYQGNPLAPGFYSSHSGVVLEANPDPHKVRIGNASGGYRNVYNNQTVDQMLNGHVLGKDAKMRYQRYVGNLPKYEKDLEAARAQMKTIPEDFYYMKSIPVNLPQAPEPEIIYPSQENLQAMATTKKYGGDSGAPHNGQPTAQQFFNFGPVPQGPVGFYMHGGTHLPEAFPQQPTAGVFFSGSPWEFAYGGAPCFECGGAHMEMGGITQFGGVNDGSMDTFKEGGNWIQKATASIKRRGTEGKCTGSKFGGPGCPPGSKAYNLAKTFRAMAKKAFGGTTDGVDQDDYIANRANSFNNVVRMNYGMAEADNQAARLNEELMNIPYARYGYNMGGNDLYQQGYNPQMQQALGNRDMAQGMLNQMNQQTANNNRQAYTNLLNVTTEYYDPSRNYVKWDLEKTGPVANEVFSGGGWKDSPEYIAEKTRNKYLGQDDKYDQDYMEAMYKDKPWETRAAQQTQQTGYQPRYMPYWISDNGQVRYDYDTPDAWKNVYQNPHGGGSWNTRGWNTPNPFFGEMFNNPNFHTALSSITPERGFFGDLFNRSGNIRNPKKITYRFNTYVNPQTGKIENTPATNQVAQSNQASPFPAGFPAVYGPQTKAPDYSFMADASSKALPGPRAEQTPDVPKSDRQKQIEAYISNMYTNNALPKTPSPFAAGFPATYGPAAKPADYNFMDDVMQNQSGPRIGFAYGGYLPMAKFGYADPNFVKWQFSKDYGASTNQPAQQGTLGDPTGGYELTGTRKKQPMSGSSINDGLSLGLALGTNFALGDEKLNMQKYINAQHNADVLFPAANPYRGNITQLGAGYGDQFGHQNQTPPGAYTKNGGYVMAAGGAVPTDVPVELTDEQIEELRRQGYEIEEA